MAALATSARTVSCSYAASKKQVASPIRSLVAPCMLAPLAQAARPERRMVITASKGGVLDAPTISSTPVKDTNTTRRKPPIYKVMLHNDNYNRREYVVKTLLKVVEQITVDDAVNVMQEAHETGVALVVACAQDQAEGYVENLRLNGLVSSLEPGH